MYYYSLKTNKEEHTLETRIGGDYDYAVYDLKQNLLKPKTLVKKADVVEFLWNKQKELKAVFVKTEIIEEEPKAVPVDTESAIEEMIKKGVEQGWKETFSREEITSTDDINQRKKTYLLQGKERHPIMQKDNEYVIVARLDMDTDNVSLEVHATPAKDMITSTEQYNKIIDNLFLGIISSMPDFIENHLCASLARQTKISYKDAVEGYRSQRTLRVRTYQSIAKMIEVAVNLYKKELGE